MLRAGAKAVLVRYERSGHEFERTGHYADRLRREAEWLDAYLKVPDDSGRLR